MVLGILSIIYATAGVIVGIKLLIAINKIRNTKEEKATITIINRV